tara:strand:- start:4507 stop:5802 length:1296 start_codon:yes stop_codon:yes gene_type:complete
MPGHINDLPVPPHSKTKKGLSQGADNGLDSLRNTNVKDFQNNTYAGLTEFLAVVLRVEEFTTRQANNPSTVIGSRGEGVSRHSLITNKPETEENRRTFIVRARIISSDTHSYMPKPVDPRDHQIIDLYPTFESNKDTITKQPQVNQLIRVQFFDRDISSKRNSNGQILELVPHNETSTYSRNLAWRQEPIPQVRNAPAPVGSSGSPGRRVPPSALKDISTSDDLVDYVDTEIFQNGVVVEREIFARWPLSVPPAVSRGQYTTPRGPGKKPYKHKGWDMKTQQSNGKKVLATLDGIVDQVIFDPLKGVNPRSGGAYVRIKHPNVYADDGSLGIYSYYMHLSKFITTKGAIVKRGDTIGLSGGGTFKQMQATGNKKPWPAPGRSNGLPPTKEMVDKYSGRSDGPHLHFEVKAVKGRKEQDITKFFNVPRREKV